MAGVVLGSVSIVVSLPFSPLPVKTAWLQRDIPKPHGAGIVKTGRRSFRFNCQYGVDSMRPLLRLTCKSPITPIIHARQRCSDSLLCAASAMDVKCCAAGQTQTVTVEKQTTKVTNAPIQGKEKTPELDDGGDGFPPRDDGDGGGGGGGGWGGGGFFLFGFLCLLALFKEEDEDKKRPRSMR
ncbi:hypothetical protein Droror1_Dr00014645 [Drosera rotundifolia]